MKNDMNIDGKQLRIILIEIQDHLAPLLDTYEQMLYHYLFRHTHLESKTEITIGIRTLRARVGFGIGIHGVPPSEFVVAKKLRSLQSKKCIEILDRSSKGTKIKVFLPRDIPDIIPVEVETPQIPLDELDFFNDPERRLLLLQREEKNCFYCMKGLSNDNFTIDHVVPQSNEKNDSYMNLVACCFECNSRKQGKNAEDFLRVLYRDGVLSIKEHKDRLEKLKALRSGDLVPDA